MKLLKDIGKIEEIQGISFKQKLIVITEQERRELVRDSILAFLQNMNGDRRVTIPSIEDWIKEQGL